MKPLLISLAFHQHVNHHACVLEGLVAGEGLCAPLPAATMGHIWCPDAMTCNAAAVEDSWA